MKHSIIVLLLIAASGRCAFADDDARTAILDQLQAQFSACAAFYALELTCVDGGEVRRRLAVVSKRADALASAIAMSQADASLRLELNLASCRSLIRDDCRAIATLVDRYGVECDPLSAGRE